MDQLHIVEFANKLQEAGLSKIEAVKGAAATRLRPIPFLPAIYLLIARDHRAHGRSEVGGETGPAVGGALDEFRGAREAAARAQES